ncbi:hypothetical protein HC231_13400 [Brenneria izadpanahii]|uniref:Uncharacterized protein n=1 Tax=Brenneria izadpanahii TaxID=2722756 RepID=A0ABX7USP2_9GAMM|nr:hypothetical protein [Brenneria izadpanahii]QTF08788.1 hypothetical protein HC231_13400 [Brenneria izadpanahii]
MFLRRYAASVCRVILVNEYWINSMGRGQALKSVMSFSRLGSSWRLAKQPD